MKKILALLTVVLFALSLLSTASAQAKSLSSDPNVSPSRTSYLRYVLTGEFPADQIHDLRMADEGTLARDSARRLAYLKPTAADVMAVRDVSERFVRAFSDTDYTQSTRVDVDAFLTPEKKTEWNSEFANQRLEWAKTFEVQRQIERISWQSIRFNEKMDMAVAIFDAASRYTHGTDALFSALPFLKEGPGHQFYELLLRKDEESWKVDGIVAEPDRDPRQDRPDFGDRAARAFETASPVWTRFASMAPLGADEQTRLHYLGDARTSELEKDPQFQVVYLTRMHPEVQAVEDVAERAMRANLEIDYRTIAAGPYGQTLNSFFLAERWPESAIGQAVDGWREEERVQHVFHTALEKVTFNQEFTLASATAVADAYIAHYWLMRMAGDTQHITRRLYLKKGSDGSWRIVDWLPNEVSSRVNAPH